MIGELANDRLFGLALTAILAGVLFFNVHVFIEALNPFLI